MRDRVSQGPLTGCLLNNKKQFFGVWVQYFACATQRGIQLLESFQLLVRLETSTS